MSFTSLHVLGTALFCGENFPTSSPVRLLIQKLFSDEAFKKNFRASLPRHDICGGSNFESLYGHCFFWIIYRQFALRQCWVTRAVGAEHCWICRSVWQQSVAVFNEFWKQKLINIFNYCMQNITTKIHYSWRHCRVKLVSLFVEISEN